MEHLNDEAVRYLCGSDSGLVSVLALGVAAMVAVVLAAALGYF